MQKKSARIIALLGALIAWFAIIAQFYLMMTNRVVSVPGTILRFFSFFTIDTNILAALCFTFIFLRGNSGVSSFFTKATTITAVTIYITIVGIVYHVLLRLTWDPEGLQKIVDELLHSVIPSIFILFWVFFTPIEGLKWKNAFSWLLYPIAFVLYTIIHGAITKFYPYMFVDVTRHGYNKVLSNAGLFLLAIFFLSLVLIATGKVMGKPVNDKKKAVKSTS